MYRVTVNLDEVAAVINALGGAAEKRLNVMRGIGGVLLTAIHRGFAREAAPVTGAA